MKSVRILFISVTSLLCVCGVLGKSVHKSKNEDSYIKSENDISNGAPILPIESGYKDVDEISSGSSTENLEKFYDMRSMYGMGSGFDVSAPYYYYIYDPRSFYDPDNRYYMGGNYYDLEKFYYANSANNNQDDTTTNIPEEIPQTTEVYEENQKSNEQEEVKAPESYIPAPYGIPSESDFNSLPRIDGNPYMMGIPAQLQGFPVFQQYYYQPEYDYKAMIEEEKRHEELEEQGLEANTLENPENFPRGGRVKREFSRMLNLMSKRKANAPYVKGRKINGNSGGVVFNADCRFGGDDRNGRGGNSGGTGNGVDEAVGAAQDAADAAAEAAENVRLRNGRRGNNRRTGNNRNGRGFQQE